MLFRLDVNNTNVELNGTNFEDGPTLVWGADNLVDGDHQLYVYVNSLQENGSVAVDYVEYVVPLLQLVTGYCVPTGIVLSGLRIYLATASIFSGPGQTPRMSPKKQSSWTIPVPLLTSTLPLCGRVVLVVNTTEEVCGPRTKMVHR